ncbi:glycine/D-amino acid oxidase-like deaminating enzyme [Aquamicrobium lusatiense]|uniref:Glycine/D-amino acid oxidase-like deaminating enzyme n=1 Tax=Aquamicrobium lusatiense TaxID=89772 RepID=A0A7W9S1S2_9HYPH|nr:FAD-binding oxidoreductase [Aquamicrobium lusatiense]MBB6011393.1 glycine/D-amino acid oxidase-like deaminating enzyme [Aquamicrobium lusatiense]
MTMAERERLFWSTGFDPLESDTISPGEAFDAVVVGAGYGGLSAALELSRQGMHVLVVDARRIGDGASSRAAGSLANVPKARLHELAGSYGEETAQAVYREAVLARAHTERIIADHAIGCDLRRCTRVMAAHSEKSMRRLQSEFPAMKTRIPEARLLSAQELRGFIGSDVYRGGMLVPDSATVNPAAYQYGLARAARAQAAKLLQNTRMIGLKPVAGGVEVELESLGRVTAAHVVLATNAETGPDTPLSAQLARSIAAVPAFCVVTEKLPPDRLAKVIRGAEIFGDTRKVLNYMALSPCGTRLVYSARAGFQEGSTADKARRIMKAFERRFPQTRGLAMDFFWSGRFAITADLIPHTGNSDRVHWMIGCCGTGITMSSYLGHKIARRILGAADADTVFRLPLPSMPAWQRRPALLGAAIRVYRVYDRYMK